MTATSKTQSARPSGRQPKELRALSIEVGRARHAEGSVLIRVGETEVLCAASIENKVPPFLRNKGIGWITAEYGLLPRSTHSRCQREAARGKQSGRTQEIQRLIGRSLRACISLEKLGEKTITLDCDVINADGGTRCASITGAWAALAIALEKEGLSEALTGQVAALSCGVTKTGLVADLDYIEDSSAETDGNFVLSKDGGIVEIQTTAEKDPLPYDDFIQLVDIAREGVKDLFALQDEAVKKAQK
ncbi:ribonuclease ph [Lasius niger]|uniref:Ribonuclease ph n=1 Tax=Lasius niger TaxID=67767 RepID=A0A0J7KWA4_LASNI|nr:ribonuclease ph [Lasius niger]